MTRTRVVTITIAGALAALTVLALTLGEYALTPVEVVRALTDPGAGFDRTVVLEWRLPRVAAAMVFGAALGVSGALFQTLTRNPLGSPDVIGFSTGAYTGAILTFAVANGLAVSTTVGALVGGLATAGVVYLLAYQRGVAGFRLIIVGIAVTAMLHAFNTWLLLRLQTEVAMSAAIWGAGSLNLVGWSEFGPAAALIAAAFVATATLAQPLRQLELGDDNAKAHGLPVERSRLAVLVVGVVLTATVTAATGPIAFVALTAPQIARRLTRGAGLPLGASALVGAVILVTADTAVQHLLPGGLPVGILTLVLGGGYLITLLAKETRRRR